MKVAKVNVKEQAEKKEQTERKEQEDLVFALDIGTRSIIGLVGEVRDEKLHVLAVEREEHSRRAMIDGQIEDIKQVAKIAGIVKGRLEEKLGCRLSRVCVAAAGRALKTQKAFFELELPQVQQIDEETISRLEAGAIEQAENEFTGVEEQENKRQFFLVGYTVSQYLLDNYPISDLRDHHGKKMRADVIATFLPSEVVESLYTTMGKINLEVISLTLEPIAAINAAIPQNIRLLNLALADIGAGTSDIALSRDGSIVGYTMATVAGDEISETLMRHYLVDFDTAERLKFELEAQEALTFTDILGLEHTATREEILKSIDGSFQKLCEEIAEKIIEVNGSAPSAVFLAGGGSKLTGIRERIAEHLEMDLNRVAIAGNNFKINATSDTCDLNNPEYATPLGIAVSAGLNLISDSCHVILNGKRAKLFRNGILTVLDILMMNGYGYQDMLGRGGKNVIVQVDGNRKVFYGTHASPAVLRINEKPGKISDVVRAGDTINFAAAIHGMDAEAQLKDAVEKEYEATATVNNEMVPMDTYLNTGDVILTGMPLNTDPLTEAEDQTIAKEDPDDRKEAEETVKSSPRLQKGNEGLHLVKPLVVTKKIGFTLNKKPLALEVKADGLPYYVMDLIQHSGLDLKHPQGEVILKVNNRDGTYQQELKPEDIVEIYYQNQSAV